MQDRHKYVWRPNDESVQTRLRYELEMGHMVRAFRDKTNEYLVDHKESFIVIGLIISLILNIIYFILILINDFLEYVINKIRKPKKEKRLPTDPITDIGELDVIWKEANADVEDSS